MGMLNLANRPSNLYTQDWSSTYAVFLNTGYAAIDWANSGGQLTNTYNSSKSRWAIIGVGIPSRPVITVNDAGTITSTALQGPRNSS